MGLLKRRAPAPTVARDLNDSERKRAITLWRLTALPREEFDATYGEMLARYRRRVADGRGPEWATVWDRALACATAALKVRQARIVPRFAPAEDAARLAEAMSFALAACVFAERFAPVLGRARAEGWSALTGDAPSAAVLEDVPVADVFGALLLARLTGDAGLAWLGQQPEALRAVAAYFGPGPSELRELADEGASRIGEPLARCRAGTTAPGLPPASCPASPSDTSPASVREDEESGGGDGARDGAEADQAPVVADAEPAAEATATAGGSEGEGEVREKGPAVVGGEGKGWEWINWVRQGLFDGGIAANAEDGWLHRIGGEAFVMVPEGFDAFAAAGSEESKNVRNRVTRLGRHRLRVWRGRKADEFRAHLEDGRKAKGMVFPGELFWDEDAPPLSKSVLDRRNG
ncbi:MAG: hypothetical protein F4029_08420 [Gammaproteobacteria bacterium]|nr:hypothetical protein [Gammaproteobacteria bacterium]MYK46238.1 hypothetical protein [Gammaproteobacteria bacterium]